MYKLLIALLLAWSMAVAPASAQTTYAFESPLTVSTVAVSLTVATYEAISPFGSMSAMVVVESSPIRYWLGNKVPTSTVGTLANVGDVIPLDNIDDIRGFKAIRDSSALSDAKLWVIYTNRR